MKNTFPNQAPSGLGNRPLIDLCQEYSVNSKTVLRILAGHGIYAEEEMNIKEIAEIAGENSFAVYEIIKDGLDATAP